MRGATWLRLAPLSVETAESPDKAAVPQNGLDSAVEP
jgi:hypothetical protein